METMFEAERITESGQTRTWSLTFDFDVILHGYACVVTTMETFQVKPKLTEYCVQIETHTNIVIMSIFYKYIDL